LVTADLDDCDQFVEEFTVGLCEIQKMVKLERTRRSFLKQVERRIQREKSLNANPSAIQNNPTNETTKWV